ncbi:TPA: response regulator transcription factor [Burkholderia cenocepacia]|uniref:response regulator transcription factor n=1 Tax=unclassified Burkholderia TaxID=2613784 RepID=UPI00158A5D9B|nr:MULTISPECIES: response regulator transcription factor [unclassified Burkholderia]HEF5874731.1 response regulator transcription factor [Burkholderia cenocepacia]
MTAITIAIADDHPIVADWLRSLPHWPPTYRVLHCSTSGSMLIESLTLAPTDIVISDFTMRGGDRPLDGFMLLRKLRDVVPDARCILFTAQSNPTVFAAATRLGVSAIVSKEDAADEVVRACRHLCSGGIRYFSPTIRAIVEQGGGLPHGEQPQLTQKELDVVRLFVSGHSLASIAKQLGRSVSTVSTQKYTAMQKLQADANINLVRYAYENGLI